MMQLCAGAWGLHTSPLGTLMPAGTPITPAPNPRCTLCGQCLFWSPRSPSTPTASGIVGGLVASGRRPVCWCRAGGRGLTPLGLNRCTFRGALRLFPPHRAHPPWPPGPTGASCLCCCPSLRFLGCLCCVQDVHSLGWSARERGKGVPPVQSARV